jgi:hypothetical protein
MRKIIKRIQYTTFQTAAFLRYDIARKILLAKRHKFLVLKYWGEGGGSFKSVLNVTKAEGNGRLFLQRCM